MTILAGTWAHGNAAVAEQPAGGVLQDVDGRNYTAVVGYRTGSGVTFEGTDRVNNFNCFHIPVPTLSWINSGRAFLETFYVLLKATNCGVVEIHAYDKDHKFYSTNGDFPTPQAGRGMSGDWSNIRDDGVQFSQYHGRDVHDRNFWSPREPDGKRHEMLFGLGITVRVRFDWGAINPANPHRRVTFLGAGANWSDVAVD